MSIIEQVHQRFRGGLALPKHKELTRGKPILEAPIPPELIIPLRQHVGESAAVTVHVGQYVRRGEQIGRATDFLSAAVHASSSGRIIAIEDRVTPHPSGRKEPCVVIATDGEDASQGLPPWPNFHSLEHSTLRNRLRQCGVVGLGGAAFPTAAKLTYSPRRSIHTLILNAVECEPYLTCDESLLLERPQEILNGLEIMRHILQVPTAVIAIGENMSASLASLKEAIDAFSSQHVRIVVVPSLYPAGSEHQLVQMITGQEVPSGGLPSDLGVVTQNVATAAAVYRAVILGEPLTSRVVTITGQGITQPHNLRVRIGTPIQYLLDFCGGAVGSNHLVIMGGPMMGFALPNVASPVVKATNCLLMPGADELPGRGAAQPCIRCGFCVDACPVGLLPQQLYWHARANDLEAVQEHHLFDCIECGCCATVCPSQIPLVQYYRQAKREVAVHEQRREQATLARERYEHRLTRLGQQADTNLSQLTRLAASALDSPGDDFDFSADELQTAEITVKQAAIQAALDRVQAKKQATLSSPANDGNDGESS